MWDHNCHRHQIIFKSSTEVACVVLGNRDDLTLAGAAWLASCALPRKGKASADWPPISLVKPESEWVQDFLNPNFWNARRSLQIHLGSAEPFFDIYGHAENVRGADFFAGTKRRSVLAASEALFCPWQLAPPLLNYPKTTIPELVKGTTLWPNISILLMSSEKDRCTLNFWEV